MGSIEEYGSLDEALAGLARHEDATDNKYSAYKCTKDFGSCKLHNVKTIFWSDVKRGEVLLQEFDGVPYAVVGEKVLDCEFGIDRKKPKGIRENDMKIVSKGGSKFRRLFERTKKVDCPAQIFIKEVCRFPEYKMETEKMSVMQQRRISNEILNYLHTGKHLVTDHAFFTFYPYLDTHICGDRKMYSKKRPKGIQILNKRASLKGKNLMDLAVQFKTTRQMPVSLARPKAFQRLYDMSNQQLIQLYYDITGEMPNNMFSMAEREFNNDNLCLLLHLAIMMANALDEAYIHEKTHRSVRVNGSEENFVPAVCKNSECSIIEPHMHCPLCTTVDSYQQPELLQQHFYSVHVKKAIEFSGLKILWCCDECEIIGRKGRKELKNGHWHCYKCGDGFEKSSYATAHFNHHLKELGDSNIHVQVNPDLYPSSPVHKLQTDSSILENYQAETSLTTASSPAKSIASRSPLKRSYAAAGLEDLQTIEQSALYGQQTVVQDEATYSVERIPGENESDTYVVSVQDTDDLSHARARIRWLELKCREFEKQKTVQNSLLEMLQQKETEQTKQIAELQKENKELNIKVGKLEKDNERIKTERGNLMKNTSLRIVKTEPPKVELTDTSWKKTGVLNKSRVKSEITILPRNVKVYARGPDGKIVQVKERKDTEGLEICPITITKLPAGMEQSSPVTTKTDGTTRTVARPLRKSIGTKFTKVNTGECIQSIRVASVKPADQSQSKTISEVEPTEDECVMEENEEESDSEQTEETQDASSELLMKEMCKQFKIMKKEIEILKQASASNTPTNTPEKN